MQAAMVLPETFIHHILKLNRMVFMARQKYIFAHSVNTWEGKIFSLSFSLCKHAVCFDYATTIFTTTI